MRDQKIKDLIINHSGKLLTIYTVLTGATGVAGWVVPSTNAILPKIVLTIFITFSAVLGFLYIRHVKINRVNNHERNAYLIGYNNTHYAFHELNRLYNDLDDFYDYNNMHVLLNDLNKIVNNLLHQLKHTLQELYQSSDILYSFKTIDYLSPFKLPHSRDVVNEKAYISIPFKIQDKIEFRDPEASTKHKIAEIVFDPKKHSPDEYTNLCQTSFYESFIHKKIVIKPDFNDYQKNLCDNRFESGIVAPVLVFGIPFAQICLGSSTPSLFREQDREIVATFSDAISVYFRQYFIYNYILEARTIVEYKNMDERGNVKEIKNNKNKELPAVDR